MTTHTLSDRLRIDISYDGFCTIRKSNRASIGFTPQEAKNLYLALYQWWKRPPTMPADDAPQMTTVLGKPGPVRADAVPDSDPFAEYYAQMPPAPHKAVEAVKAFQAFVLSHTRAAISNIPMPNLSLMALRGDALRFKPTVDPWRDTSLPSIADPDRPRCPVAKATTDVCVERCNLSA